MKKSVLVILSIFALSSCSKDDAPVQDTSQAKYRIEVSHEGNKEAFTEFLSLTLVTADSEPTITANGEFESAQQANGIYSFYSSDASTPFDREIETSSDVRSLVVSCLMTPLDADSGNKMETTVKIYRNDVWLESHRHIFKGLEYEYFNVTINN